MECYIAMALSKEGCSDLKGIVREFFNATREYIPTQSDIIVSDNIVIIKQLQTSAIIVLANTYLLVHCSSSITM